MRGAPPGLTEVLEDTVEFRPEVAVTRVVLVSEVETAADVAPEGVPQATANTASPIIKTPVRSDIGVLFMIT